VSAKNILYKVVYETTKTKAKAATKIHAEYIEME
jgi:hypothetical protein